MKASLTVTVLILAVFAAAGWRQQDAANRLRNEQRTLVSQATALGLEITDATPGGFRHRSAERPRIDHETEAKNFASDLIHLIKEMADDSHREETEDSMQKASAIVERLYRLDAGQIRILLDELRKTSTIEEETRNDIIGLAIASLSDSHPETAITIFMEAGELRSSNQVIRKVLGNWAEQDPLAALDWVRNHGGRFPDLMDRKTKVAVIQGCARKDPKLAFQLAPEIGMDNREDVANEIVRTARTPESQSAVFSMLHELSSRPGAEEPLPNSYRILGTLMAGQGFDTSIKWLAAAKPSPEECTLLADAIEPEKTRSETGKWIDWMNANLPPDALEEHAIPMFLGWTRLDYQAAGEWLSSTPDGPLKNTALAEYVDALVLHQPATAAKWMELLPADVERGELMRQIHTAWSERDAAAAAAFAQKHGIQP